MPDENVTEPEASEPDPAKTSSDGPPASAEPEENMEPAEPSESTESGGAEAHDETSSTDLEATGNLTGEALVDQLEDRLETPSAPSEVTQSHLKGLLESLVFASDHPQKPTDLAKAASANVKEVRALLEVLKEEYKPRGIQLDEVAGGWIFRTSGAYAPFVRDLTKQKPVRLSRAQV